MISVTSITNEYILQPTLLEKHRKTLDWLSAALLWQNEFTFFQKLLDKLAMKVTTVNEKKKIDHFQNLIIYYTGELIPGLRKKLRKHESRLADTLKTKNEQKIEYFKEHDALMQELEAFNVSYIEYKMEFFEFIEEVI